MKTNIKTYSELITLPTFEERYRYLRCFSPIGVETFGSDRYLNQLLYNSYEWHKVRDRAIIRDNGCDLAIPDRQILGKVYIHHINPITVDDILNNNPDIYNLDYLVCVSFNTHNAIHYGDEDLLIKEFVARTPNDTCPWRQ